jgi:hypothetical protein
LEGLIIKQVIKGKKFIVSILVLSLLMNAYLFNEVYKANKLDTSVAFNNYSKWQTSYQLFTGHLGRFLKNPTNEESYYLLLAEAEFIRTFKTVSISNYYAEKNMDELGLSSFRLSNQINDIVNELFYVQGYDNLTEKQLDNLQEFHENLELLSKELDKNQSKRLESNSNDSFQKIQLDLSTLIEKTIIQNEGIISQLELQ